MTIQRMAAGVAWWLLTACQPEVATPPAVAASTQAAPATIAVAAKAQADASLVLPGALREATTVADLEAMFGKANVAITEAPGPEGKASRSVVLFPDDPTRRAYVSFHDPGTMAGLALVLVNDAGSLWRGKRGVHVGMSFADLRQANGKPFTFSGFDEDGRAWIRDQWSPATDDDATLGALDVDGNDNLYFGVDLGVRGGGKGIPADAYPMEDSTSSDDSKYPRLGEIVEVTAISAYSSLDDEWE